MNNIWISWSSGKDSAFMFMFLQETRQYKILSLLTTINKKYQRVSLHGTRRKLLELQAKQLNIPLHITEIPDKCSCKEYKFEMAHTIQKAEKENINHMAFGDIHLESVKKYREEQFSQCSIKPLFPIWRKAHTLHPQDIINHQIKAIITCIDTTKLSSDLLGHPYNSEFLNRLPKDVDPFGENGEFHTFVYSMPLFSHPIEYALGKTVQHENFIYIDVASINEINDL